MLDFLQEFFEGIILTYHDDVTYRVAVLCFVQQLLLTARRAMQFTPSSPIVPFM